MKLKHHRRVTMTKAPFILLVNPWITDFAAYDLWAKPLGILLLGSLLRDAGFGVAFLDCLDRHDSFTNHHPDVQPGVHRRYGTGKYPKMLIPTPEAYREIPRHYYRHGIHPESLGRQMRLLPKPDLIWVTSVMTYWYPGVQQTIAVLREIFSDVPVWLGGIYARLCSRHAKQTSGASEVVTLPPGRLPGRIEAALGFPVKNRHLWGSLNGSPPPAFDLVSPLTHAPLITSRGCPFHCPYCASQILQPKWERQSGEAVYAQIINWSRQYGVRDFAFYDDALLLEAETTLKPALERVCREGPDVRFHTPNALHIRALTPQWCHLLRQSGFTTLRLGLETTRSDKHRQWGGKVETGMFFSAVDHLLSAGFAASQIGVYLLCGLPEQFPEEVADAIRVVEKVGAQPYLAEYSPVPGTLLWPQARSVSAYDLEEEPLYHNNTFFALRRSEFSYDDLLHLKELARLSRRANLELLT